ncbi:MAG: sigma-70 family RNA polymerase sigma factor, partial [Hymenobacteraceae bacterium]|nr:sigma-70 family RNA polymerase sigma factor [Hymenobacteraceae bacterium]MDX5397796.1 sigma-70 family RNA polymerase sigma factor [Hymenobacteraceae bacterium]MDX5513875.1 sigma-70 family RNA polymerase sigma factor [Hymenobacteraceae bacterium]
DIFQNSLIVLYENAASDKLTELNCEVKTYIYSVAKNQILRLQKKNSTTINLEQQDDINLYTDPVTDQHNEAYVQEMVQQALNLAGNECKQILKLFYFLNHDLKSIAVMLHYKNENVVKVKKSQCLKKLSLLILNKKREADTKSL